MSEEQVTVRWLKDSEAGGHWIGGRLYSGKGPVTMFEEKYIAGRYSRVEKVAEPGEVQEVPAGAAEVLVKAGFVEPVESPGKPAKAAHAKARRR